MVRMINGRTGTEMQVAEDRVEEYKAAGHKLATSSDTGKPAEKPKKAVKKTKK